MCKILWFLFITHVANVYHEFNACQIQFERRDILFSIRWSKQTYCQSMFSEINNSLPKIFFFLLEKDVIILYFRVENDKNRILTDSAKNHEQNWAMKQTSERLTALSYLCIFKFHILTISAVLSPQSETSAPIFMFTRVRFNPSMTDCPENKWLHIIKAFSGKY